MKSGTISEKKRKEKKKQGKQTQRTRKWPSKDVVARKRHRRDIHKINQLETETGTKAQTEEINIRQPHNTLISRLRTKGSPTNGEIQPRQEDKGKDNECDTWRF